MKNVEIIDISRSKMCQSCCGKGCASCKCTGYLKDDHFILVDTRNNIAFDVDQEGK